jgi:hypothetical protein
MKPAAAAIGLAALAAVMATSAASARRVTPAPRGHPRIYVANNDCHGHAYSPTTITLACGDDRLYTTVVSYRGNDYGAPRAAAAANFHLHRCGRGCPFAWYAAEGMGALTLRRVVRCQDGLLYYSRAFYAFPAHSRGIFPASAGNEVDIEPYERCHVVDSPRRTNPGRRNAPRSDWSVTGSDSSAPSDAETSSTERALIATRTAEATLQLASPPAGATKLSLAPAGAAKLLEPEALTPYKRVASEEGGHLVERSTLWATPTAPEELVRYINAHLPHAESSSIGTSGGSFTPPHGHETLAEIVKRESVNGWSEELGLPTESSVLRTRALEIGILHDPAGGFYVGVNAWAIWERPRPSYSLLGNNVGSVTISVVHPKKNRRQPPIVITEAPRVAALVETVNALPVAESSGFAFNCPDFRLGEAQRALLLQFRESLGGPVIAELVDHVSTCLDATSIAVPGHPPLALSEARQLPLHVERITGMRLRGL